MVFITDLNIKKLGDKDTIISCTLFEFFNNSKRSYFVFF